MGLALDSTGVVSPCDPTLPPPFGKRVSQAQLFQEDLLSLTPNLPRTWGGGGGGGASSLLPDLPLLSSDTAALMKPIEVSGLGLVRL